MKRLIITLTTCLLCSTACSPVVPASPTPTAPASESSASVQLNLFATQTQSAAVVATTSAQQELNVSPVPVHSPSPLPVITQAPEQAGPFRQVSRKEAPVLGRVLDLQPVDEGILLLSEGGVSYYQDDEWTAYLTMMTGNLVGVDTNRSAWATDANGSISKSNFAVNSHALEVQDTLAWILYQPEEGWSPITTTVGSPVSFGLVTDSRGWLWVSTARDVRSFHGIWQVHESQTMGMPTPAEEATLEFSLYPNLNSGEIYAGRCDWGGAGPIGGGGWRAFDGQSWTEPDPLLNSGCVTAFAQDNEGGIWVAQDANLWHYRSEATAPEQAALPEPPAPYRFGYINNLSNAPDGSLWAQLALCTEQACFGGEAVYRLNDGVWQQIGEPSPAGGQRLLFDGTGTAWLLSAGSIYRVVEEQFQQVPGLVVQAAAVDHAGTLWLVAQSSGSPTLWVQR
jgi:ligand-binding sensor domain-containing protein